jgi:hypothetical protein
MFVLNHACKENQKFNELRAGERVMMQALEELPCA